MNENVNVYKFGGNIDVKNENKDVEIKLMDNIRRQQKIKF